MVKVTQEANVILQEVEKRLKKTESNIQALDLKLQFYTKQFEKSVVDTKGDFNNLIYESQKETHSSNTQTLSIFVAVMGIIFGFVSFSIAPGLLFLERITLFALLIFAMIILILFNRLLR